MKDWNEIAGRLIENYQHSSVSGGPSIYKTAHDKGFIAVHGDKLREAIATALEAASDPVNIAEHDPWMHRHANKLADFDIRIGALEDTVNQGLTVTYGPAPGKPALVSDKWLEDLNNKLAQITQRVNILTGRQQVTEDVQRGTHDLITTWKAEMIDRGSWEARVAAIEAWRDRMEASAKETVEKLKAMRGEA